MYLSRLDNEVIFKKAFTDNFVFRSFVHDILGIDINPERIETEKSFSPKQGNIDIKYDIFAEDSNKRVIVEIQRVMYDHNYHRFLHYHLQAITEQQRRSANYKVERTVYTVVIITAPYKKDQDTGEFYTDEVLVSKVNPHNLMGIERRIYNHEMLFLNPSYKEPATPPRIRDWMDLISESILHPESPNINFANEGVRRASELVEQDNLDPELLREAKFAVMKQEVLELKWEGGKKEALMEVTKNAIMNGLSNEIIAGLTKLSIEQIQQVRETMNGG